MNIDWSSFGPDLLVELISVGMLGLIVNWLLERQRRRYEARQSQRVSRAAKRRYLTHIRDEIEANLRLMQGKNTEKPSRPSSFLRTLIFKTTYWDALVPSGLLPSLLGQGEQDLLGRIADFYHTLRIIDAHMGNLDAHHLASKYEPAVEAVFQMGAISYIEDEMRSAIAQATELIGQLERGIGALGK